mmetsp:Transcript_19054/g.34051  ORF Transcript_19054/g.34051 Transcript_19054/m.34051 type:complete len:415 (-) Transcript_19054:142-1386(-)
MEEESLGGPENDDGKEGHKDPPANNPDRKEEHKDPPPQNPPRNDLPSDEKKHAVGRNQENDYQDEFAQNSKILSIEGLAPAEYKVTHSDDDDDDDDDLDEKESEELKAFFAKQLQLTDKLLHEDEIQRVAGKQPYFPKLYIEIDLCPRVNRAYPDKRKILNMLFGASGLVGMTGLDSWIPELKRCFPKTVKLPKGTEKLSNADPKKGTIVLEYEATRTGKAKYNVMRNELFLKTGSLEEPLYFRMKERFANFVRVFKKPNYELVTFRIPPNATYEVARTAIYEYVFGGKGLRPTHIYKLMRIPLKAGKNTHDGSEINGRTMLAIFKPRGMNALRILLKDKSELRYKTHQIDTTIRLWRPRKNKAHPQSNTPEKHDRRPQPQQPYTTPQPETPQHDMDFYVSSSSRLRKKRRSVQ